MGPWETTSIHKHPRAIASAQQKPSRGCNFFAFFPCFGRPWAKAAVKRVQLFLRRRVDQVQLFQAVAAAPTTSARNFWVARFLARVGASTSIHEHPVRCTGRNRSCVHGRARASTSIHEDPVRCTGKQRSWVHGRSRASTSIHERPVRCAGRNRSWAHGRARASTSILCAAHVGIAHGPM